MATVVEAVKDLIGSFVDDEPKMPLHIGEAMSCWLYLTTISEASTYEQIGLNTTNDPELKSKLQEALKLCSSQEARLRSFMEKEGVPLPPVSEGKPQSDPAAIPFGVKLTDDEMANGLSVKMVAAVLACATAGTQCIRNDIALMWMEFEQEQIAFGITLKTLMRKRGWLKVPPVFCPPGAPMQ